MAASGIMTGRKVSSRPTPAPRWVEGAAEGPSIVGLIPISAAPDPDRRGSATKCTTPFERFADFLRRRGLDTIDSGREFHAFRSPEDTSCCSPCWTERLRRVMLEVLSGDSLSPARLAQPVQASFGRAVLGEDQRRVLPRRSTNPPNRAPRCTGTPTGADGVVPHQPPGGRGPRALPHVLGDSFQVECRPAAAKWANMREVAEELRRRLISIFLPRRGRPSSGVRRYREVPDRPALEFRTVLLRRIFHGDNGTLWGSAQVTRRDGPGWSRT